MLGWIIYDNISGSENYIQWHIDKFRAEGVELRLVLTSAIDYSNLPEFAIVRAIQPKLSARLEKLGVRVFNNARVSHICNDKALTYKLASENDIPIMSTYYDVEAVDNYPVVIKSKNGHGGTEVFMARDREQLYSLANRLGDNYVVQKVASDVGKDVRVYVLGGKIISAMLRCSNSDFRSNFCLGGSASVYELNAEEKALVNKVVALMEFDYVGIDFVFDKGKMVFNEIEDVVGSRMLYTYTKVDIVDKYVKYILKEMKKGGDCV